SRLAMPGPTGPSAGSTRTAITSTDPAPQESVPVTWNCTVVALVLTTEAVALSLWHCVFEDASGAGLSQAAAVRRAAPERTRRTVRRSIGSRIYGSSPVGTILGSVRHRWGWRLSGRW